MRWFIVSVLLFCSTSFSQITIQGTVTRSGSPTVPVANAVVEITRLDPGAADTLQTSLGSATTDANGRYVFNYTTGVRQADPGVPQTFALSDAYPNPFTAGTRLEMGVEAPHEFSISIYNILGQKLASIEQVLPFGGYDIQWDGAEIPGVYFAWIRGGGKTSVIKLVQLSRHRGASALRITPGTKALMGGVATLPKTGAAALLRVTVTSAGYAAYTSAPLSYAAQSVNVALTHLGSIFSAQRDAAVKAAGTHFTALKKTLPKLDAARAMADWLRMQPDIEEAGAVDDGNAWGRYADGPIIIFINNAVGGDGTTLHKEVNRLSTLSPLPGRGPNDVPGKNKMAVGNAFGVTFGNADEFAEMLAEQVGYKSTRVSTVDLLKSGAANDAGIFYFFGHGGYGSVKGGGTEYGIWTATERTLEDDSVYADDLREHRLVWMYGQHDWETRTGTAVVETSLTKYAFTGQFVRKYLHFAPNSLIFIASCSSAKHSVFVNRFLQQGAALFAGFTETWYSYYLNDCSDTFFDRVLGTSNEGLMMAPRAETPPQRAFNGPDVLAWMNSKGYDKGSPDGSSRLILVSATGADKPADPVAPSIATMFVHPYDKKLYIYGNFGSDPGSDGKVTVNNTERSIQSWSYFAPAQMDMIICDIPTDGAGSYGDVQVSVRDIKSNVTQLSRYKGNFTLTHQTGDGRQYEIKLNLQLRVALLGFRMKPGDKPMFNQPTYAIDADMASTGKSTASGSTGGLVSWSGSVPELHNNIDGGSSPTSFIASAWFDPEHFKMQLCMSGGVQDGIIQNTGGKVTTMPIIYGLDTFDGKHDNFPSYVEIPLNADFSISKGSATAKGVASYFSVLAPMMDTVKLEWDTITPDAPPLEKTKR